MHPYPETFIVTEGTARFTVGDEQITVAAGNVVVVPAETVHGFKNAADAKLRVTSIPTRARSSCRPTSSVLAVEIFAKPDCIEVGHGRLGRGVFAHQDIAEGDTIEICPTLEVEDSAVSGTLSDYVFSSNDDEHIVILLLGFGMLYNHSADANCGVRRARRAGDRVRRPARPSSAATSSSINYGNDWWDTRELEPQ